MGVLIAVNLERDILQTLFEVNLCDLGYGLSLESIGTTKLVLDGCEISYPSDWDGRKAQRS